MNADISASAPLDETLTASTSDDGDIPRSWFSGIYNLSGSLGFTARAFAVCSAGSQASLQASTLSLDSTGDQAVACPSGQRAISGGADSNDTNKAYVFYSAPTDPAGGAVETRAVARSWSTYLLTFPHPQAFKFYAVCEPDPSATPASPTGQQAAALKKCKKKHSKKARKRCRKRAKKLPV